MMAAPPNRYFLRILLFGFLVSSVPVIIVGLFSYMKSSDTIQRNVNASKLLQLEQMQMNVEQVMRTVDHSMTYFVNSSFLKSAMLEPLNVEQFQLFNQIKQEVNHLQTFDTGIENIILLSTRENWYIDNSGLYRLSELDKKDQLLQYKELPFDSQWITEPVSNTVLLGQSSSRCTYGISLVKKLPLTASTKNGLAVSTIPSCYLNELLSFDKNSEAVLVFNDKGELLFGQNEELLPSDGLFTALYQDISESDSVLAQFDTQLEGTDYTVSYRKSDYNGWTYASITSLESLSKQSRAIGWFTVFICLALLAITLLVTWFGSQRLYRPIEQLFVSVFQLFPSKHDKPSSDGFVYIADQIRHVIREKSELESTMNNQIDSLRTLFMMELYQGKSNSRTIEERLKTLSLPAAFKGYAIMTLRIDFFEGTSYSKGDTDLLLFAVNNIVEELVDASDRLAPIVYEQSQITLLLNREHNLDTFFAQLVPLAEQIAHTVKEVLNLSVSFGFSGYHDKLKSAGTALEESMEAYKHLKRFGDSSAMFYRDLPQKLSFNTSYPVRLQTELNDAIKLGDRAKSDEALAELFEAVFKQQLSAHDFELTTARLLIDLIHLSQSLGIHEMELGDHSSLFEYLFKPHSPREVRSWFLQNIVEPIIVAVEERTNSQYKNISEEIIHMIHQQYDQELTLEAIAASMHYNANYVSSVFRKETGTSFSEYLAAHRHRIALGLLQDTNISVKEISERLQYTNPQNFIRSFRKLEGTTPGKYREQHQPG
ncbi:helix-turn-helix domain-containing protein [Paenibacillus sp. KS-LC4]|uniref:helix-turn-helix domain-containing protein n=1 Tax=Paenibacillus sp. KS-LC4 TaxID=2979727 RepID=UPI0030D59922